MIKLLPQCAKCGSPVSDSVETEIEQHGKVKFGSYINSQWICDDCKVSQQEKKNNKSPKENPSSSFINKKDANQESGSIGVASATDVSPNTPQADESNL
jgi:hypothetical protein